MKQCHETSRATFLSHPPQRTPLTEVWNLNFNGVKSGRSQLVLVTRLYNSTLDGDVPPEINTPGTNGTNGGM